MAKHEPKADAVVAARQFYADLARPLDAREECEAGDGVAEVLRDEAAAKLRACGAGAAEAAKYADAVLEVLRARDRAVVGAGVEEEIERRAARTEERVRLRWVQAVSQVWAWPDTRTGVWALLFAHGQPPERVDSIRKIAEMRAMSPENVNNMVDEVQRILELPRTHLQKSEAAIGSYQRTNGAKS